MVRTQLTQTLTKAVFIAPSLGLAVSRLLTPDPSGMGTHQQLGLPPCSMRVLFGIPCPSCGMTTSWALFSRGEFATSFSVNPAGFLLACLTVIGLLIGITAIARKKPVSKPQFQSTVLTTLAIFAFAIIHWLWKLIS